MCENESLAPPGAKYNQLVVISLSRSGPQSLSTFVFVASFLSHGLRSVLGSFNQVE